MTTSVSSAAATGLPADRRSLLSGAALAAIVSATAAVPALAAEPAGPVEKAYAAWRSAAKATDVAVNAAYAAEDSYQDPEAPRWHPSTSVCGYTIQVIDDADGNQRRRYVLDHSAESVARLRQIVEAPETVYRLEDGWDPSMHSSTVAAAQRSLEVILTWQAECRRREDACGLTVAREHEKPLVAAETQACETILAMTPTTLREAAFQAAVLTASWDEGAVTRLLKRLAALADIPPYLEEA